MSAHESSHQSQEGDGSQSLAPIPGLLLHLFEADGPSIDTAVKDLNVAMADIPAEERESAYMAFVNDYFSDDPEPVKEAYHSLFVLSQATTRSGTVNIRRELIVSYHSPFCAVEHTLMKAGRTLKARLDYEYISAVEIAAQTTQERVPTLDPTVRGRESIQGTPQLQFHRIPERVRNAPSAPPNIGFATPPLGRGPRIQHQLSTPPVSTRGSNSTQAADLIDNFVSSVPSDYMIDRKEATRTRRDVQGLKIPGGRFVGMNDSRLFNVWLKKLTVQARANALSGDAVGLYHFLVQSLGEAVIAKLSPTAPGTPSLSAKWVAEIRRVLEALQVECRGVSAEVVKWQAEQLFDALRQRQDESVQAFIKRYDLSASELEAQMGEAVPDARKLTGLIRGLSGDARKRAMDHVSQAGVAVTYSHLIQHLNHRERLENAMQPGKVRPRPSGSPENPSAHTEPESPAPTFPPRNKDGKAKKELCRFFYKHGKCKHGTGCRYEHVRRGQAQATAAAAVAAPIETQEDSASEDGDSSDQDADICEQQLYLVRDDVQKPGPTIFLRHDTCPSPLRCLIDTGAFYNYIPSALAEKFGLELRPLDEDMAPYVILADQGRAMLLGKVKLGSTIFRVLRSEACHAILGVVSMCEMGITLSFKTDGVRGRLVKVSIKKPDGHQIQLTAASAGDPDRLQYELSGKEDCDNSHLGNNHIFQIWSPPTELEHIVHATDLTKQLQTDWAPVKGASADFQWRCRRITGSEVRDRPEQEFVYEINWSNPAPGVDRARSADFSHALYSKLSDSQKRYFDDEVKSYVERSWWLPEKDCPTSNPMVVFPVSQISKDGYAKTTKCRPVVDCRGVNKHLGVAGYPGATVAEILRDTRLRWEPYSRLITRDASRAFYCVRTVHKSYLTLNGRAYSSSRLVFGLKCGPCALLSCLDHMLAVSASLLDKADAEALSKSGVYLYLDDLTILVSCGTSPVADRFLTALNKVASLTGFSFPDEKGNDNLKDHQFRHLGITWSFEGGLLSFSCVKHPVPHLTTSGDLFPSTWTCRKLFAVAGQAGWGSDPLGVHPRVRLCGDLLRTVGGQQLRQHGWDGRFTLEKGTWDYNVLHRCIQEIVEHISHRCCHTTGSSPCRELLVWSDASPSGAGYCCYAGPGGGVKEWYLGGNAFIWSGPSRSYHINRKELIALGKAVTYVHSLVVECPSLILSRDTGGSTLPLKRVVFHSDSQTALSWAELGHAGCSSTEKVMVKRLANNLRELIDEIRAYGVEVAMKKVTGEANAEADKLSRLLEDMGLHTQTGDVEVEDPSSQRLSVVVSPNDGGLGSPGDEARRRFASIQQSSEKMKDIIHKLSEADYPDGILVDGKTEYLKVDNGLLVALKFPHGDTAEPARQVIVIPTDSELGFSEAKRIITSYHVSGIHDHCRRTRWRVGRDFWIPGITAIAAKIVRECPDCQAAATSRFFGLSGGGYNHLDAGVRNIWSVVSCDLAGPFVKSKQNHTYALVFVCEFSKFTYMLGIPDSSGRSVSHGMETVFDILGTPERLRSDGGPCFRSRFLGNFLSRRGVKHQVCLPYAPWQNGSAEAAVGSLKRTLRRYRDVYNANGR
ncbi:retrovirus polyprotein, putative [Perkinsus marinus ATCC 50983]|uniref:Retrovirus polyprotein, putative n=1 Tax=Perkinsus marinus (strain ATCC 50983 / TXsc) TaxID=423536 RepID=C5KFS1_PERM5|nr:retrovirus polyprotein, putative [Perkinsus marinus ATCC 50983]EER16669.1 retrovirus polyprotein, putative [Perkinsus marinus ATCC 50983]|eukprot:XP_002784873.1 retrovirus polyprotein, putative [Perkinsus marinus ATCC 50983]